MRRATTAEELARTCPGRSVLDHVTSRWGVLILSALHERELRFAELRARMPGISEKVLAQTLRLLVEDGLVVRIPRPSSAPHVSYALTDRGADVNQPLQDLLERIARHTAADTASAGDRIAGGATGAPQAQRCPSIPSAASSSSPA